MKSISSLSNALAARFASVWPRSTRYSIASNVGAGQRDAGSKKGASVAAGTIASQDRAAEFSLRNFAAGPNLSPASIASRRRKMPDWKPEIQRRLAPLNLVPTREDAASEGEDGDGGEARRIAQRAKGVAKIVRDTLEKIPTRLSRHNWLAVKGLFDGLDSGCPSATSISSFPTPPNSTGVTTIGSPSQLALSPASHNPKPPPNSIFSPSVLLRLISIPTKISASISSKPARSPLAINPPSFFSSPRS
jgi:hypothetical protein